jgi:hypothetical protein
MKIIILGMTIEEGRTKASGESKKEFSGRRSGGTDKHLFGASAEKFAVLARYA